MEIFWLLWQLGVIANLKILKAAFLCIYSSEFMSHLENKMNLLLSDSLSFCL